MIGYQCLVWFDAFPFRFPKRMCKRCMSFEFLSVSVAQNPNVNVKLKHKTDKKK